MSELDRETILHLMDKTTEQVFSIRNSSSYLPLINCCNKVLSDRGYDVTTDADGWKVVAAPAGWESVETYCP